MRASLPLLGEARKGNALAASSPAATIASPPQPVMGTDGKSVALDCLNAAIDASSMQRKVLAYDCGISEAQFSRLTTGAQGFPLTLLDKLPRAVVADFLQRMQDRHDDPVAVAAEQLIVAGLRFIRLVRSMRPRMAKARL